MYCLIGVSAPSIIMHDIILLLQKHKLHMQYKARRRELYTHTCLLCGMVYVICVTKKIQLCKTLVLSNHSEDFHMYKQPC